MTQAAQSVKGSEQNLAAALAETPEIAGRQGVGKANRHARILEEKLDPGSAEKRLAQQRRRSIVRVAECEEGMSRFEIPLDDARATTVRAAIDHEVSAVLRARQCTELVPADVKSVEQLQAHALTRFAEMHLTATAERRRAPYTAHILYSTPLDPTENAGLADSVYGQQVPCTILPQPGDPASHTSSNASTTSPHASMGNF